MENNDMITITDNGIETKYIITSIIPKVNGMKIKLMPFEGPEISIEVVKKISNDNQSGQ